MKFCEAVDYSFKIPILLNKDNLNCPGARRTFGFDPQSNELVKTISENTQIPLRYIIKALDSIPVIDQVHDLVLGIPGDMEKFLSPDVYIIYTQPKQMTHFIHSIARIEKKPFISPYSLLSICGNVFAQSYRQGWISLSFGCPESRNFGGVKNDEVVMGLPYHVVKKIRDAGVMDSNM
ncbi:MAG: DUF169 domain-containing protein [Bacteroidales bacterium]